MLIGHLPAGYLASTVALGRIHADEAARRRLLLVALVCSVLPDLDTIYFYLVDSSQHHHAFVTHWPIFWAALTAIGVGVAAIRNDRLLRLAVLVGGMSAMLHLVLDSIAGQVYWLAPFSDVSVTLVEIPARYDSWILSFVTHWTFAVEMTLVLAAVTVLVWRRRRD